MPVWYLEDMRKKYDIMVLGAGIGGLTAACLLSYKKKVLVLEKNTNFGGYCSSFKRGGFIFESAVHSINGCKQGHFFNNVLKECGFEKKIKFIKHKNMLRVLFPDYDITFPQEDIDKYIEILIGHFPKESFGIKNLFKKMCSIFLEIENINKNKRLMKSPNLTEFLRLSLKEMLDVYLDDEKLKAIISQHWVYCGLPPSRLSSIYYIIVYLDYLLNGSGFIEGGTKAVIDSLIDRIKSNNGCVCNSEGVNKILIKGPKAIGAETINGNFFYCDYMISGMDSIRTFKQFSNINNKIKQHYIQRLEKLQPTISNFKIYLGLKIDIKKLGIFDYDIFVNGTYDIENSYMYSIQNEAKRAPFMISVYSNIDSTVCEKNKTVLSISMLSGYDFWVGLDRVEYNKKKISLANILIKRVEQIIPNLKRNIEVMEVATPLTMERYTSSNRGAMYGWNKDVHFARFGIANMQTPIKNLFLSSNWTKIGGGIVGPMRSAVRVCDYVKNNQGY
jgi:phytoene dehydrogenase-like protein